MPKQAKVIEGVSSNAIPFSQLFEQNEPVVLKGAVSQWPLVRAGLETPEKAMVLLEQSNTGEPATVYIGDPEIKARFAYNDTCTGFNFSTASLALSEVFEKIRYGFNEDHHPYYYINSLLLDRAFPNLINESDIRFDHEEFQNTSRVAKVWVGTESRASAHYDIPKNLACCAVGKRRFTLFAPEQVHNLYPGPLSPTPGGQVITMADLAQPDFDRFPKLEIALENAVIADLEPGDLLYYPSMWWHEVEAFDKFNVMINFWWINAPRYMGNPLDALMHAMLEIRDRPENEKQAWRELFDYYIFGESESVREHIPIEARGALGELDDMQARKLRALLQRSLNR